MDTSSTEPAVVVIGGGTGTYTALLGLKQHTSRLTAVVTMADSGGSSGRLRDEFGYLPPGDVRQCLVALTPTETENRILRQLFDYRFTRGTSLLGHSFGNLFLTALTDITGSEDQAIIEASRLLNIRGQVLPATLTNSHLVATLADGTRIEGEAAIGARTERLDVPIAGVQLEPPAVLHPAVAEAITSADLIVIGPGDLYTSIIPALLVEGLAEAIRQAPGQVVLVTNVMTKHGETDGFAASDFVRVVARYLGGATHIDAVVINTGAVSPSLRESYLAEQAEPVRPDIEHCRRLVGHVVAAPVAAAGHLFRHDPDHLSAVLLHVVGGRSENDTPPSNVARPMRQEE